MVDSSQNYRFSKLANCRYGKQEKQVVDSFKTTMKTCFGSKQAAEYGKPEKQVVVDSSRNYREIMLRELTSSRIW